MVDGKLFTLYYQYPLLEKENGSPLMEFQNILGGNTPESSQGQNLSLLNAPNYFHSIYVVLGITDNLEMI